MFQKAERTKLKLRLGIEGPSGSGKTFSALRIATGLVGPDGKICVIDTENNSASLYSEQFSFDVGVLGAPYTPERYVEYIHGAEKAGYDCIVIDSGSHEWMGPGGVLEIHDKMPGNSWVNWSKVNPRHEDFVQALLTSPLHIIITLRTKQTHIQEENSSGKKIIKKMGMQPQQRDGLDYELTAVLTMDISNQANGSKDRSGLFPIGEWFLPTEETGKSLNNWLNHGKDVVLSAVDESNKQEFINKWDGRIIAGNTAISGGKTYQLTSDQAAALSGHKNFKD